MNIEESLNEYMLGNSKKIDEKDYEFATLSEIFNKGQEISEFLEDCSFESNSEEFQKKVKTGIELLEKATYMVNEVGMFSVNEVAKEIATAHLKYLLLPVLLGTLTLKIATSRHQERLENINLAELYFRDFLKRCKDYEITDDRIPELKSEELNLEDNNEKLPSSNLMTITEERQLKIQQFKLMKEFQETEKILKHSLNDLNEDVLRDLYFVQLKKWILTAQNELSSLKMEKSVLKHMSNMNINDSKKEKPKPKTEGRKPIIIVKDKLQKEVFGLGYPSMPTMTVDEFYKQRYPESNEDVNSSHPTPNSLQQMANDPNATQNKWELEDIEQEEKVEKDDLTTLQKARAFDDWKDTHRRGCGNRQNKG